MRYSGINERVLRLGGLHKYSMLCIYFFTIIFYLVNNYNKILEFLKIDHHLLNLKTTLVFCFLHSLPIPNLMNVLCSFLS